MFEITVDKNEVFLKGRFDASQEETAQKVFDQVNESANVNFKDLEYISSCGLGVLLGTQKRLEEEGAKLTLTNMNDHIRDVFMYARFDIIFEIK